MSRKGRLGRRPFFMPIALGRAGSRYDIAVAETFSGGGWQPRVAGARRKSLKGRPETGMLPAGKIHSQVPGLSRQVSGSGIQHQEQVQDLYPYPNPKTRT